jgi:hypothetical protein
MLAKQTSTGSCLSRVACDQELGREELAPGRPVHGVFANHRLDREAEVTLLTERAAVGHLERAARGASPVVRDVAVSANVQFLKLVHGVLPCAF